MLKRNNVITTVAGYATSTATVVASTLTGAAIGGIVTTSLHEADPVVETEETFYYSAPVLTGAVGGGVFGMSLGLIVGDYTEEKVRNFLHKREVKKAQNKKDQTKVVD